MSRDISKMKVLIVDDFALARLMVRNALAPFKIEAVDVAANGEEALGKIKQAVGEGKPYDLVFSDVSMPLMNGLQLLEACRAMPETKDLNFVMVTAHGEQQSVLAALSSGAADYIMKPFEQAQFERTVVRIFDRMGVVKDK